MSANAKIGLACAGGAIEGAAYEIGALCALDESLDGVSFENLDVYVGVSAGGFINACLANKISPKRIARAFLSQENGIPPIAPEHFFSPAYKEYGRRLAELPELALATVRNYLENPFDLSLTGSLVNLTSSLPTGLFTNDNLGEYLAESFMLDGRTNDFRQLDATLRIVATNLDTGEAVRFGEPPYDAVPISQAVQASTALPLFYTPVKVNGSHFIDGVARRTVHASVALKSGADLVFCVNPIVPFNINRQDEFNHIVQESLAEKGLPTVLSQTFRLMIASRMRTGMRNYEHTHPDANLILIEPDPGNYRMFFTNIFSFNKRKEVCEMAYDNTRRYLRNNIAELTPKLEKHGISVNRETLYDNERHLFSEGELSNPGGNTPKKVFSEMDDVLDRLNSLIDTMGPAA